MRYSWPEMEHSRLLQPNLLSRLSIIILGVMTSWLGTKLWPQNGSVAYGLLRGVPADTAPCGLSSISALAKGCHFESYTATWQPPQCYDRELDEEFRSLKSWKFYSDKKGTQEFGWTDAESDSGQLWTTWEFHLWQCAFIWKKEVKIAHGLVSGTINYHQCLDNSLMQEHKYPNEHIVIPYWPRFSSCRPPSDISIHQLDLNSA